MATENTDLVRKIKNPKKILYIILALLTFISLPVIKIGVSGWKNGVIQRTDGGDKSYQRSSTTVTISSTPYEIRIPFGSNINFELQTDDVPWKVQINNGHIYDRPPINSPEYTSQDYGSNVRSVKVWVQPNRKAELSYYFTQAS